MPDTGKIDGYLYDVMQQSSSSMGTSSLALKKNINHKEDFLVMVEFFDEKQLALYKNSIATLGGKIVGRDKVQPILIVEATKHVIESITDIKGVYTIWYDAEARRL